MENNGIRPSTDFTLWSFSALDGRSFNEGFLYKARGYGINFVMWVERLN